ncbi:MAG: ribosome recycling factor, partial [Firmicutes bacterium]|nr:ribosome recycling factor [Bacillota bacterium]
MQDHISQSEEQMKKAFTFLSEEYKLVRVGKANPFILDKVKVDYYGNPTPINQIGNITVEARSLIFKPWDASMINQVNKAIQ